jgi:uncharacterized surface protein with fasciclin (FAS1) repeats
LGEIYASQEVFRWSHDFIKLHNLKSKLTELLPMRTQIASSCNKIASSCNRLATTVAIAAIVTGLSLPAHAVTLAQTSPTTPTPAKPAPKATGTIVDVAVANGSFKTLVKAVKAAGLAETLSGTGPFTVFAPTDAAFAALPKGTLDTLLKPENKNKLRQVLTYHVVQGSVLSTAIKPGRVNTIQGSPVTLAVSGKNVTVNNAKVTAADVKASNGVIHVIDKVILPPGL